MRISYALVLAFALFAAPVQSVLGQTVNTGDAFLLVSTAALNESNYRRAVILCLPVADDQHLGVILNRPSTRTLADLFPDHGPSKQVAEPVFFGGPMSQRAIFAIVRGAQSPGVGSLRIIDGLFLAMTEKTVDLAIEQSPGNARFYAGDVVWRPGELREELDNGYWHVLDVDLEVLFRKDTRPLWEELSRLARSPRAAIGATTLARLPD